MAGENLAQRLAAAFDTAAIVEPEPDELPTTVADAEAIEDRLIATLGPIKAFKLGATIAGVRTTLGLSAQFFGAIPATRVFDDGADLGSGPARQTGVECEYAFRFARPLPADGPLDAETVMAAIDAVHPSIEIPGTRFPKLAQLGGLGLVADAGAVGALVLGPALPVGDPARFRSARVVLEVDGEETFVGSGEPIDGGPVGPLVAFAKQARARGYRIEPGQVVATGSCSGYIVVERGRRIVARFEALGASVSMRFV